MTFKELMKDLSWLKKDTDTSLINVCEELLKALNVNDDTEFYQFKNLVFCIDVYHYKSNIEIPTFYCLLANYTEEDLVNFLLQINILYRNNTDGKRKVDGVIYYCDGNWFRRSKVNNFEYWELIDNKYMDKCEELYYS